MSRSRQHRGPSATALDERLQFSFRFLETTNPRFDLSRCGTEYLRLLLSRLKDLSGLYLNEFLSSRSHALRIHRINFDDQRVAERGFGIPGKREVDRNAWQFSLSANEHGRVHGFLADNTFYVRWLDPEHNLYAGN